MMHSVTKLKQIGCMCDSNNKLEQWIIDHENDCSDICGYFDCVISTTDAAGDHKYKHIGVVVKYELFP